MAGRRVPQLCLAITQRVESGAQEPVFAMPVMETMLDEGYEAYHRLPPRKELLDAFAPFARLRGRGFAKCLENMHRSHLHGFRAFAHAHYSKRPSEQIAASLERLGDCTSSRSDPDWRQRGVCDSSSSGSASWWAGR